MKKEKLITVSNEEKESLTEKLRLRFRDLKSRISELRKEGHDPIIADFHLRNFDSKLRWAQYSMKKEDFDKVNEVLEHAEHEIVEESKRKVTNIKEDVDQKIKEKLNELSPQTEEKEELVEENKEEDIELEPELKQEPEQEVSDVQEDELLSETIEEVKEEIILDNTDKYFHLKSGEDLKSIQELIDALSFMHSDDFEFHTRKYDNDFSKWIESVFDDPVLAKKIKGVKDKQIMAVILKEEKRGE